MIVVDQPQSPSNITIMDLSELKLKLYVDLIHSLALESPPFPDVVDELTLGTIMAKISCLNDTSFSAAENVDSDPYESSRPTICGALRESELLTFGMAPARHHFDLSTRQRMLEEIQGTLRSIAEFFHGDREETFNEESDTLTRLPEIIQAYKIRIEDKKQEASFSSQRVAELIDKVNQTHKDLDHELHRAVSVTLPTHDTTRTASMDLLAATIETSLIKLSLTSTRAERALYNHQPQTSTLDPGVNIAKAIEAAYSSLKKNEKEMKMQSQSLDRQLQEYESLMQLVDGGKNGYQQIINDWTKVQQETDECLKDLRRLGWTGD